ncbi:MAG: EF-P beta-lysylation protein EpmB [Gammaproteobacteria bacterium]|nr:EF-P beta-lysylation protein EpmB [Gammaproteobacteria bacterium]NNC97693.1 EF-P beta-lysylation protein EpmB [Gammaproteobacteria bacterium]NNM14138.1 EF-P beta-lysylation protein EpmB [Gammaproteobacteria bacterium]
MITPLSNKRLINNTAWSKKHTTDWQAQMRDAVTEPTMLLDLLDIPHALLTKANQAHALFPLKVPKAYVSRMQKGNINDPLLQQVLPLGTETDEHPDFTQDPVADLQHNPVPGIVHKYSGRVLMITTGACAVHCRYCFRRNFPYSEQSAARQGWQGALDYIRADKSIHEVILSGGDPLSLSNNKLDNLFTELDNITHLKTIRLHTRQPIVLPDRIDTGFLQLISRQTKNLVMVLHANHANEIDDTVRAVCEQLLAQGVTMLNQSVLLRNINDEPETLIELSHALFSCGVLPYYLNLLDQVRGASHFAVCQTQAKEIHTSMQKILPGYLVPKLVKDSPTIPYKTWL